MYVYINHDFFCVSQNGGNAPSTRRFVKRTSNPISESPRNWQLLRKKKSRQNGVKTAPPLWPDKLSPSPYPTRSTIADCGAPQNRGFRDETFGNLFKKNGLGVYCVFIFAWPGGFCRTSFSSTTPWRKSIECCTMYKILGRTERTVHERDVTKMPYLLKLLTVIVTPLLSWPLKM